VEHLCWINAVFRASPPCVNCAKNSPILPTKGCFLQISHRSAAGEVLLHPHERPELLPAASAATLRAALTGWLSRSVPSHPARTPACGPPPAKHSGKKPGAPLHSDSSQSIVFWPCRLPWPGCRGRASSFFDDLSLHLSYSLWIHS